VRTNNIVRVATNTEPKNSQNPRKTFSRVVSNSSTETEQSTSTESMLVQIMQMLKDQDLRLKKLRAISKLLITIMTNPSYNGVECKWITTALTRTASYLMYRKY
jgi:hypothetical protein